MDIPYLRQLSRMLEFKSNYMKCTYWDRTCRLCKNHEDDQTHVLQECPALEKTRTKYSHKREQYFSNDIQILKLSVEMIDKIM